MTNIPAFITLGSNIDAERNLPEAARRLAARFSVVATSGVYRSAAIDRNGSVIKDQGTFLNAAMLLDVDETVKPLTLKYEILRPLESDMGRVRTDNKYAPRTIDLDLVLYNDVVCDIHGMILPDPDIVRRAHLAFPIADCAPDFRHPVTGDTLFEVARHITWTSFVEITDIPLLTS